MKKAQVILNGAQGRMGREIATLLETHSRAELLTEIVSGSSSAWTRINPDKNSVVVDFSSPAGFLQALSWCKEHEVPFVSGTTGLTAKHHVALASAAKTIPVLWSPNTSVGINLFLRLVASLGSALQEFDMQIEEFHHSKKVDAPSGTAKLLQEAVENAAGRRLPPVMSGRGGGIVGTHKLHLMAEEEVLTIEHIALKRTVFARGALTAAVWLRGKKPGLYTMGDLLGK